MRALTGVDTDRLPEEKQRGLTIDLGFAELDLGEFVLGIVDVPGHERFIRNMLAGAAGNDLAMLVVAADDSVMPQTREHLEILKLLDVQHGVTVITKSDLAENDQLEMVEHDIRELVQGTFLEDGKVVRTSGITGHGIDELTSALAELCQSLRRESYQMPFRMAIDRSFTVSGVGAVVTGSVASGTIELGNVVEHLPTRQALRVRSIESHGREVASVRHGQRAAIGLAGIHHRDVKRGNEIATPGYLAPSRILTARLSISRQSPWPLKHREDIRLHIGTSECVANVSLLEQSSLASDESALVQLFTESPVTAVAHQPFVIRALSPAVTMGGGQVLQPLSQRISRPDRQKIRFTKGIASDSEAARVSAALQSYGLAGWTELQLVRDSAVASVRLKEVFNQLVSDSTLVALHLKSHEKVLVHKEAVESVESKVVDSLSLFHEQQPLTSSMPRRQLLQQMRRADSEPVMVAILDRMATQQKLIAHADGVARAGFSPQMNEQTQALFDKVVYAYRSSKFKPPTFDELTSETNIPAPEMRKIIALAVDQGQLTQITSQLYLFTGNERQMLEIVDRQLSKDDGLTVSQIKQLLGTSRKFAVPFCEYLDRIGITRRKGDVRMRAGTR